MADPKYQRMMLSDTSKAALKIPSQAAEAWRYHEGAREWASKD
jgi:hypothetical protein